jgi:hypothetical protein
MDEAGNSGKSQSPEAPELRRRVFISYASQDAAVAQKVCSALEAGAELWSQTFDRDVSYYSG